MGIPGRDPGRAMMRRTIPMIALSALAAALTLLSVAITPLTAAADEGRAVTLYADQSTGRCS
jgi:hypothetical protein